MSMFEVVAAAAKEYAARRTMHRHRLPTGRADASIVRAAAVRLVVAVVWAIIVGLLTYGGAWALDLPDDEQALIAVLSAAGAAIYVVFFADAA